MKSEINSETDLARWTVGTITSSNRNTWKYDALGSRLFVNMCGGVSIQGADPSTIQNIVSSHGTIFFPPRVPKARSQRTTFQKHTRHLSWCLN